MSEPAPSVLVLREHGPIDLREITRLTAIRMGWSLMYADVDAVLEREQEAGRVRMVSDDADYRNRWWEAVAPSEAARKAEREGGGT